jgi:Tfp pilus assembly protein PilO
MITRYQRTIVLKELLIPIVMGIISVSLFVYGIVPGIQNIQEMVVSMEQMRKESDAIRKKISVLNQMDESEIQNNVDILLSAVPADKQVATIFSTIETVAGEAGVLITDLTITNPGSISSDSGTIAKINPKIGSNSIAVSTGISGSYEHIQSFIQTIRHVRRLLRVSKINETFTGDSASPSGKMKVELEAFYAPLPKSIGKVTDELKPLSTNEEELLVKLNEYPLIVQNAIDTTTVITGSKTDPFSE